MPIARIPLDFKIQSRTASLGKDARLVNGLKESREDKVEVIKRPGLLAQARSGTIPSGQGQGLFTWNDYTIAAWNNTVYYISNGVSTVLGTVVGSLVPFSWTTVTGDTKLAFHNGSNLYTVNAGSPPTFIGGVGLSGVVSSVNVTSGGGYYGYSTACTVTVGATTTINATGHNLVVGQGVQFTGTMPTGLVVGTTYQVATSAANSFTINTATDAGGVGAAVTTSGSGSGMAFMASPVVTFSASPSGVPATAVGVATLFNHQVSGVILTTHGTGYLSTPTITFSAPPVGTQATLASLSGFSFPYLLGGQVFNTSTQGSGYITSPSVSALRTDGATATGYGNLSGNSVVSVIFTSQNPAPIVTALAWVFTIQGPPNETATATAVMASSAITGPFAPGLVYLNNRVYVMTSADAKVYSSHVDDPSLWYSPSLAASSDPDGGVAIARHLNYIVVFGAWSTEFFYDNSGGQDPSVVSTLAVYQSGKLEIGCAHGYSVANAEQTVIWMGQGLTEGRGIFMLDGMSPTKISTRYIEKYLNADTLAPRPSGASSVRAYCMKLAGHTLYVLSLINSNVTFVYDIDEQEWYQWTSQSGDTGTVNSGTETYFKPTAFNGNIEYNAGVYLQGDIDGDLYIMSPQYYTDDNGELIYFRAVSPNMDSGTNKRKFYPRIEIIGDKIVGSAYVRHSDNDYATWSTYRQVNLAIDRPVLYQNGQARRRAWEVFVSDNIPVRLEAAELDIVIGETGEA